MTWIVAKVRVHLILGLQSFIRVTRGHRSVVSRNLRVTPAWSIGLFASSSFFVVLNYMIHLRLDQHLDASLAGHFTISNMETDFGMRTVAGAHPSLWYKYNYIYVSAN